MALGALRKSLAKSEKPKDVPSFLLAAKLCACQPDLCSEGVGYSKRAILHVHRGTSVYKARALHVQGVALRSQVQVASSISIAFWLERRGGTEA